MTNSHKTAERIVREWWPDGGDLPDEFKPPWDELRKLIERAITQSHEEGRKEMREKCVKIVEDFNYSKEHVHLHLTENDGKTVSIVNQIAQRLREMK